MSPLPGEEKAMATKGAVAAVETVRVAVAAGVELGRSASVAVAVGIRDMVASLLAGDSAVKVSKTGAFVVFTGIVTVVFAEIGAGPQAARLQDSRQKRIFVSILFLPHAFAIVCTVK